MSKSPNHNVSGELPHILYILSFTTSPSPPFLTSSVQTLLHQIFLDPQLNEDDEEFLLEMLAEGLELEHKLKNLINSR